MNKKVINTCELIENAVYLIMIKANKNWYWGKHGNKDSVIIETRTIVHLCLYFATIKDDADPPHI